MSSAVIQLLVLAGIAVFLILRLRNVLGSREGFEKSAAPLPAPDASRTRKGFEVIEGGPDRDIVDHAPEGSEAAKALAAMKLVEPSFSVSDFLQGARGAYEMILTAFDKGDMDRIRPFLSQDVFDSFSEVVAARKSRGVTVTTDFQGLRELTLADATFDRSTQEAEISVRFVAELVSSVRDMGGQVVEGDPKSSRKQKDVWTFARTMGANDPNWQLVATGD
jgi:predicted lipid-binding transport protein (Tim44 family)